MTDSIHSTTDLADVLDFAFRNGCRDFSDLYVAALKATCRRPADTRDRWTVADVIGVTLEAVAVVRKSERLRG